MHIETLEERSYRVYPGSEESWEMRLKALSFNVYLHRGKPGGR